MEGAPDGNKKTTPIYNTRSSKKRPRAQADEADDGEGMAGDKKKRGDGQAGGGDGAGASGDAGGEDDFVTKKFMLELESRITHGFASRLDVIEQHVLENAGQIRELKADVEAREEQLEKRLNRKIDAKNKEMTAKYEKLAAAAADVVGGQIRTDKQKESYDHHRKTIRIWPIKGNDTGKLIKHFFQTKLKITGPAFEQLGKWDFKRVGETNAKYPDEAVVLFSTKEIRDSVKAAGKNLANETDCGMRINVPGFLMDNYRLLASVGYTIKNAQSDVRRAIKFDDAARDLVLDIRVDNEWRRITPREAMEAAKTNPNIRTGPRKMDSKGINDLLVGGKSSPATGANTVNID